MIDFTENQRRTMARALSVLALVVVGAFAAAIAWALFRFAALAAPAIVPVILGFFLALFFKPYYLWWKRAVKNPTIALVIMLLTVFIPFGFLVWYAGAVMVDEISNLVRQGPHLVEQVLAFFRGNFPKFAALLDQFNIPYDRLGDFYTNYGSAAAKAGAGALKCLAGVLSALVTLIFFVFFLMTKERRGSEVVASLPFFKEETRVFLGEQVDTFFDILVSFFQRQTVICLIEGLYYGLGFTCVGLPYGFLIGFALGVLNLIPLFGSVICLPVALPLAYFAGGSLTRLVLVLVVWGLGQILDGYFITPKIQGNKTGLGYAGVIFSFFFWSTLLGPVLGMLLAIPLSAFCVVLYRAVRRKYWREER